MSRLPYLQTIQNNETASGVFRGLNQNIVTGDGEFASMKNMSDRNYPAISTRRHRGEAIFMPEKCNGILWKNGLFVVDGTKCYYDGTEIQGLAVEDSKKMLVGMGAYITIWPDKKVYNTNDGTFKDMQAEFKSSELTYSKPSDNDTTHIKIAAEGICHMNTDGTSEPFSIYDSIDITGCSLFSETISKTITSAGEGYIIVPGIIESTQTQSTEVTFKRVVPDMDFVCERNNRLWGVSSANHELYSSKLGDPSNWQSYEGISTDSYAATIGSDGDFTGIAAFSNYMLFFKESSIHVLRGDKPSNYSITEEKVPGVREGCSGSLATISDMMYYVSRFGVYTFDGALPAKISQNITDEITEAIGGIYDNKYYISCKLNGNQTVLVYDPATKIWDQEDETKFEFVTSVEGDLYYAEDGLISMVVGTREENMEWNIESGDISEGLLDDKYIIGLKFNFWLSKGSHADIFIKYDSDPEWTRQKTISSTENRTYNISLIPRRCNKYRYRIEGYGEFSLLGVGRKFQRGSELNGNMGFKLR